MQGDQHGHDHGDHLESGVMPAIAHIHQHMHRDMHRRGSGRRLSSVAHDEMQDSINSFRFHRNPEAFKKDDKRDTLYEEVLKTFKKDQQGLSNERKSIGILRSIFLPSFPQPLFLPRYLSSTCPIITFLLPLIVPLQLFCLSQSQSCHSRARSLQGAGMFARSAIMRGLLFRTKGFVICACHYTYLLPPDRCTSSDAPFSLPLGALPHSSAIQRHLTLALRHHPGNVKSR